MGFYGQIMYEFTKLFSKVMVTKKSSSNEPVTPPAENNDLFFQATDMWEQINIKPSNHWIQLDGETPIDETKTITIGHSVPGDADVSKTTVAFAHITEDFPDENDYTQLKNGDYFKIATSQYDKAGHFIDVDNPGYTYYKLPAAQLTIIAPDNETDEDGDITPNDSDVLQVKGDGQWITLTNNGNALKISHTINNTTENKTDSNAFECLSPYESISKSEYLEAMDEEGKGSAEIESMTSVLNNLPSDMTIIPLESGDLIASQQITNDSNGHIIATTPIYYKLPVQPTTVTFEQHESRITDLEHRLNNDAEIKKTVTPIGESTQIEYGDYEDDIVQRVYDVGNITDIYSNNSNAMTITKTIGNLDGEEDSVLAALKILLGKQARSSYTISEAIQDLAEKMVNQQDQINVLMKAVGNSSTE